MHVSESPGIEFGYLKSCSLFGGITAEAFEIIRPLIRIDRFGAGEPILREGAVNDRIYFIEQGTVEIFKSLPATGDETTVRHIVTMKSGDTFGEMELIDIQPCEASVRTTEPTVTLSLSNHDLYRISKIDMKTYALLIMNLAREMSRRLRHMDVLLVTNDGRSIRRLPSQ